MDSWVVGSGSSSRATRAARVSLAQPPRMARVERGVQIDHQPRPRQGAGRERRVGGSIRRGWPPQAEPQPHAPPRARPRRRRACPGRHRSATTRRSVIPSRRRSPPFSRGVTPTEPMPCTFEWPRIGIRPAWGDRSSLASGPDCDRLHVGNAVIVMGDPHGPTEDDVLGSRVIVGDRVDLLAAHPRFALDSLPAARSQVGDPFVGPLAMPFEKPGIMRAEFDDAFWRYPSATRDHRRCVAGHSWWRSWCPNSRLSGSLGTRKLTSPVSTTGFDHDDLTSASTNGLERGHQSRMVAGGIAPDQEQPGRLARCPPTRSSPFRSRCCW